MFVFEVCNLTSYSSKYLILNSTLYSITFSIVPSSMSEIECNTSAQVSDDTLGLTPRAHYRCQLTDLIDFTWGGALSKCIVGASVKSDLWPCVKSWEMLCVMQIYASALSNETAFVIQPEKTHTIRQKSPIRRGTEVVCED